MTDEPETRAAEREALEAFLKLMPRLALLHGFRDTATASAETFAIPVGVLRALHALSAQPEPRPAGEVRSGDGGGLRALREKLHDGCAEKRVAADRQQPGAARHAYLRGERDALAAAVRLVDAALAAQTEQPGAGQTAPADAVREAANAIIAAGYNPATAEHLAQIALSTASVHGEGGLLIRATDAGQINRPGHRVVALDNGCLAPILMEVAERSILEETHHA